jgi:hypothetical protein
MLVVCLIAAGGFNTGGTDNGGVGGKKGYIYSSSRDLIHILRFLVNEDKTALPSSCTTTKHLMNEEPRDEM